MQKLIDGIWTDCTQADLVIGDRYRILVGDGGWQEQEYLEVAVKPIVEITNVQIPVAELNGSIYWIKKDTPIIITADCPLPDGELMVMVERVVDGVNAVDDIRTKAVISGGSMTMSFIFDTSGNYIFRASRLNEGLDRIGEGYHLNFDNVEFDVYIEWP